MNMPDEMNSASAQDKTIVNLLERAASRNDPDAQYELAVLYMLGQRGLPNDWQVAKRLFLSASRQGHEAARRILEDFAPSNPVARWLYFRGGAADKVRKVVAGTLMNI